MVRIGVLSTCFVLILFKVYAQDSVRVDLEDFAERLFQVQDEDANYDDIYESLLLFYTQPLELNSASREELASLYLLSPVQLQALVAYREEQGRLVSIYELLNIPAFDRTAIQSLLPFVSVYESTEAIQLNGRPVKKTEHQWLMRWTRDVQERRGFVPREEVINDDTVQRTPYAGGRDKWYGRFRSVQRGRYSAGFTVEQDAGEAFEFGKKQAGFDFWSGHLMMEQKGKITRWVVGDYQLQIGQGVVFGAGFNPGKGAETVRAIPRSTLGIRPYTSVVETGFFRGAAATFEQDGWALTGLYSRLSQDATRQDPDTLTSQLQVNSVLQSGLHRTSGELAGRNALLEENAGLILWKDLRPGFRMGGTFLRTAFDASISPDERPYNQFYFRGKQNDIGGLFLEYAHGNATWFGEGARSSSGGLGATAGVVVAMSKAWSAALSVRNYDRDFHSFYANALSEGSTNRNESGVYVGLQFKPSRKWNWTAYFDRFTFPWLRFDADAPSEGYEWLTRLTYQPSRSVTLFGQVRHQTDQETNRESNFGALLDVRKTNYVVNLQIQANDWLQIRSRVQSSYQDRGGVFTRGYVLVQDANVRWKKWRLSLRMAVFDTDDFDNAQYVYERDVLYAFSIPAYSGRGVRQYALVRYQFNRSWDAWIRYAQTTFSDREEIGSGLDTIEGNRRGEVKAMVRIKF